MKVSAFLIALLITLVTCRSQEKTDQKDLLMKYTVFNRSISTGTMAGTIHLNEAEGVGIAWVNGQEFKYGTIEFDVKGKDILQQSFVGIAFHGLNDSTYEAIYFRPFNFQSNDPVRKSHAVQYIANPKYDWPRLRSEFPNKYEQPVNPAPDPNAWFHVRITVESNTINVFVNNSNDASLTVKPLVSLAGNKIGFWAGNNSSGDWKNLTIHSK
ncbi:MAG: hypothetical protein ACJ748_10625 [Flavisolibacter sp.]